MEISIVKMAKIKISQYRFWGVRPFAKRAKGDINATGTIYRDGGTAVTDFIFDSYYDGNINLEVYPYAENYTLVPLSELNNYLEQNRHLPNLPGKKLTGQVDSAEIDRLLLEKLEEQAVYIIQLNNKLEQQQEQHDKEIAELKSRFQALEAREQTSPNTLIQPLQPKTQSDF